jgi:hypothetical protein
LQQGDLPVLQLNLVGRFCVLIGVVAGFIVWLLLTLIVGNRPLNTGFSSLSGIAMASVTDVAYRLTNRREMGIVRFVHCDCGATYLAIPLWCLGLLLFTTFGHWLIFEQ